MNAPIPSATLDAPEFRIVKIGDLSPSPTNPRSRRGFDAASLNELAQTMQPPVGVIEPLVVRVMSVKLQSTKKVDAWPLPSPGKKPDASAEADQIEEVTQYEIVCGERRWRAAQIAKLESLPVLVRKLTDFEVLRLQLIENEKRKDLDALEEAEGYEKLMQQKDADGNPYTAETIAKLQGVSKGTIYARLKLLALCPDARNAFFDGKIDASTALLIARIPVEKLQLQALKEVSAEADWSNQLMAKGDKMSYRRAREILQDKFMLDLDRAPFNIQDAALLPKAGNCTACPKRTGNAPDLFDDVGSKDVCSDPVCFGMKKAAHVLKLQKDAEAEGNEVIAGKAAKKLIPQQYYDTTTQLRDHGYATLDTPIPGDAQKRTLGQVLEENQLLTQVAGKAAVQKTVVANPHRDGQMIETVNIEAATKALREAGFEITLKGKDTSAQSQQDQAKQDQAKQREKDKQELIVENTFRARLFDTLHAQIEADMLDPNSSTFPKLYRMLAIQMWHDHDYYDIEDIVALMRKYTTLPNAEEGTEIDWQSHITEFGDNLPNLTPAQHLMLCIELPLLAQEITTSYHTSKATTMLEMAGELGIDADSMRKAVAKELKPAAKKPAAKAKPSAAKPAETKAASPAAEAAKTPSTPTPAAQAQDLGAETKPAACWPFPTPNYSNAPEKKGKRKSAAAA